MRSQKKLGEILRDRGLITDEQLSEALQQQRATHDFLGCVFLRKGYLAPEQLLSALSEQFDIPVISIKEAYIDWSLVLKFSPSLILDAGCFPVARDAWSVTLAITDPLNVWAIKKAEEEARPLKLKLALTSDDDMQEALKRYRQQVKGSIYKV